MHPPSLREARRCVVRGALNTQGNRYQGVGAAASWWEGPLWEFLFLELTFLVIIRTLHMCSR